MKTRSSMIWKCFTRTSNSMCKCSLCGMAFSMRRGATSNLFRHIKLKHQTIADRYFPEYPTQSTSRVDASSSSGLGDLSIQNPNDFDTRFDTGSYTATNGSYGIPAKSLTSYPVIDQQIFKMLVKCNLPIDMIDDKQFRTLITMLKDDYLIPSRAAFETELLPKIYKTARTSIENCILSVTELSLSIESWISEKDQKYINVLAIFLNKGNQLESHILECFEWGGLPGEVFTEVTRIIDKWQIGSKICAIVSDNSNDKIRIGIKGLAAKGYPCVPCFAQSMNSIVQNSIKILEEFTIKLWKVYGSVTNNMVKQDQNIPTNWIDIYKMFKEFVESHNQILINKKLICEEKSTIHSIINLLKIFYEITEEMSRDGILLASKVILYLRGIRNHLTRMLKTNQIAVVKDIISILQSNLLTCFGDVETDPVYSLASILDPRFKAHAFNKEENFKNAYKMIVEELEPKIAIKDEMVDEMDIQDTEITTDISDSLQSSSLWAEFDETVMKSQENFSASNKQINMELEKYLSEQHTDRRCNPLEWWNVKQTTYPHLYILARKYLCMGATIKHSAYVFSKQGQLLDARRRYISSGKVESLVFLHQNL